MIKFLKPLRNNQGSFTLLMVMGVVCIGALMVIQSSSYFIGINQHHKSLRVRNNIDQVMGALAQRIKHSYNLAQLDPSCASAGAGFVSRTIPGGQICVPSQGLCITSPGISESQTPFCASIGVNQMNWSYQPSVPITAGQSTGVSVPLTGQDRMTDFVIPGINNSLWKSCTYPNVCVRILLCPLGNTDCQLNNAEAIQVVRLGSL